MAKHLDLGRRGEQIAAEHLRNNGYRILEQNWRFKHAEIDIIAEKGGELVFVEVKTRTGDWYGDPEVAVDWRKERYLQRASAAYINLKRYDGEIRFDILAITFRENSSHDLYHIEDAFFPGLQRP